MGATFISSASAVITHESHSDVQFTFNPTMKLTLTPDTTVSDCTGYSYTPTFCITGLTPGNIGTSNIVTATVNSTSSTGYTLSATVGGPDGAGTTTYTDNDLKLAGTSTGADKFEMIASGTTALSVGKWGYTIDSGTTYGSIPYVNDASATPTILNKTVDYAGSPATGYTGSYNTPIQIGAYADATQIAGAYKNVINLTSITNIQTRTVTLNKNDNNVASYNIVSVDGTAITPTTNGSYAEGQVLGIEAVCANSTSFWGWSISGDFGQIANRDSATTTYAVGGNDVVLTAYCQPAMQSFTAAMCTTSPLKVVDVRDSKEYMVAMLPDGNCWMLDNLDLDLNNSTLRSSLNSTNTNATATALNALNNGGGSDSDGYAQAAWNGGQPNYWGYNGDTTNSHIYGMANSQGLCNPAINTSADTFYPCKSPAPGVTEGYQGNHYTHDTVLDKYDPVTFAEVNEAVASAEFHAGMGSYKIGTYYNFCAASAGSYCYSDTATTYSSGATSDICPAGWRLPVGGAGNEPTNEFLALRNAIMAISPNTTDGTKADSYQGMLSLPLSGYYFTGSAIYQGQAGAIWGSNSNGVLYARGLTYRATGSNSLTMTSSGKRNYGRTIRCILKQLGQFF